jgi:hypothetical protein
MPRAKLGIELGKSDAVMINMDHASGAHVLKTAALKLAYQFSRICVTLKCSGNGAVEWQNFMDANPIK